MVKFYEFNSHEYYALIKAENEEQAFNFYYEAVAGNSLDEVIGEGKPQEISEYEALLTLGNTEEASKLPFGEVLDHITQPTPSLILIDGSLM